MAILSMATGVLVVTGGLATRLVAQESPARAGEAEKPTASKAEKPSKAPAEPRTAAEFLARGKERLAQKEFELALDDLGKAIRLEPRPAPLFAARAEVWAAEHQRDMEIDDLCRAIYLDPMNADHLLARRGFVVGPGASRARHG